MRTDSYRQIHLARHASQVARRIRSGGLLPLVLLFATPTQAGEPSLEPLVVPEELSAVTCNPEPSGIVWSPRRRRYLVVTDDSGLHRKRSWHRPLLLALGEDGRFDRTPIWIAGVDAINDAESICAGPGGDYFLVTSHSPDRKDRLPAARRLLLRLEDGRDGLRVVASMDLTRVRGGRSLLTLAGLPVDGRLDIEALAFHRGALWLGLKSPLTERGEATILRIDNPLDVLAAGELRARDLERFAAFPLCVESRGRRVCQGISDMTFLSDGSLVLSANAPKGGPKDHGGALWHVPSPIGKRPPVLLDRFLELKPEGVSLSSSGRSLVVVFDCGEQTPRWTEVPLPATERN